MPDYNDKNIPTLNDVIEDDQSDNTKQHDRETENTDKKRDISEDNAIETAPVNKDQTSENNAVTDDVAEFHEIASSTEDIQHIATNLLSELENDVASSMQSTTGTLRPDPDSLQAVINEVVDKLMPELEQQLKRMIHEALQDRLTKNSLDS
jgi:hypothetical protein